MFWVLLFWRVVAMAMFHSHSATSILALADPTSGVSIASRYGAEAKGVPAEVLPGFSRSNASSSAVVLGGARVVRHMAGERAPALCEIDCGDESLCEVAVDDVGFEFGVGAFAAGGVCTQLQRGSLPHCFGDGCLLQSSGTWIANGRAVEATGDGYETFFRGDVVRARVSVDDDGPVLSLERVRPTRAGRAVVKALGALAFPARATQLRPFVFLRALDGSAPAAARLLAPKPAFRFGITQDEFPEEYEEAASLVATKCSAAPGDVVEEIMAFLEWSDFFPRE